MRIILCIICSVNSWLNLKWEKHDIFCKKILLIDIIKMVCIVYHLCNPIYIAMRNRKSIHRIKNQSCEVTLKMMIHLYYLYYKHKYWNKQDLQNHFLLKKKTYHYNTKRILKHLAFQNAPKNFIIFVIRWSLLVSVPSPAAIGLGQQNEKKKKEIKRLKTSFEHFRGLAIRYCSV